MDKEQQTVEQELIDLKIYAQLFHNKIITLANKINSDELWYAEGNMQDVIDNIENTKITE